MRRTRALIAAAVLVGAGLLGTSVQGLTQLDARLASQDRARDALKQERPVADRRDCPWRDDRRS